MTKFAAGERYTLVEYDVIYDGSYEGVESITEMIKPGLMYEFIFVVRPEIREVGNMYGFLKDLESRLPGIGVNYIEVSDDGKVVTVQVFDPPGVYPAVELKYIAYIIMAIAAVIIAYFGWRAIDRITALVERIVLLVPPVPAEWAPYFWGVVLFTIGCIGVYLVIRALRRTSS
jgi:hypothetical protein